MEKDKYAAPSVDGLLDILELMSGQQRPFGPTELSRALGITNNLVFRIMRRLTQRGYAETDANGHYTLGPKFMTVGLSLQASFELRRRARRHLEELCQTTGETTQIQTLEDDQMLCFDSVAPSSPFYLTVVPGSRILAHASAFGKAVMAFIPEARLEGIISKGLASLTPATITEPGRLLKELEAVRRDGLAYDMEEYTAGVICVGAPVFGADGLVKAGAGVTGLSSRMGKDAIAKLGSIVLKTASNISSDIGYSGDFFNNLTR